MTARACAGAVIGSIAALALGLVPKCVATIRLSSAWVADIQDKPGDDGARGKSSGAGVTARAGYLFKNLEAANTDQRVRLQANPQQMFGLSEHLLR